MYLILSNTIGTPNHSIEDDILTIPSKETECIERKRKPTIGRSNRN